MAKTFNDAVLDFFRNKPVRIERACYVDGRKYLAPPRLSLEEKLYQASTNLGRFWNTPLRNFWKTVYIKYRDELWKTRKEKAGRPAPTAIPASDNHDGKPAA